jgi:transposase
VEGRTSKGLADLLKTLPGIEQVKRVCIDMCRPFSAAIKEVLPQAQIHIDRFHIIKHLNDTVETDRKSRWRELSLAERKAYRHIRWWLFKDRRALNKDERRRLDSFLKSSPQLRETYWLAQEFRRILFGRHSQETVVGLLKSWMEKAKRHFRGFIKMLRNWFDPIVNACCHPLSNARQEGINNTLKLIKRRGYRFTNRHAFRLRIFAHLSPS